ncbi:glycosyltransferase family 39 protein [Lysinibacter sp. HNR]|uniref:glycosyltransferase family 39 protein n=1 Tax=Lysinibacter sp. HNR TaxID=3031408 RepID=UPI002434D0AC|nr:glycosyltransferase family 39 protein [Lysinibacter sp. HNR]WGD37055.1 glycosyltransferase family 39 protein [Lysinibacter sp. HNR]
MPPVAPHKNAPTHEGVPSSLRARTLVLLGSLATLISVAGSWIPSFWGDEAASVMSAERSWSSMFDMLTTVDAVHGLYYSFLHAWVDLFGASEFSVRLPSAIGVGVATAGLALLTTRLTRPSVGIVAAILFMTLPRTTYNGIETRAYAFTMALVVWLMVYLISLVSRREKRFWPWVGFAALFAVSNVLFIYTVLFALVFAVVGLTMRPDKATIWRSVLWIGAGALVALPVIIIAFFQREQIAFLHSRVGFTVKALFETPWFTQPLPAIIGWSLIALGIVIGLVVLWLQYRGRSVPAPLASLYGRRDKNLPRILVVGCAWLFVPSVLLAIGNSFTPLYSPRYLSFTGPAIALLMAVGVVAVSRSVRVKMLVPVLTIAVVAATVPTYLGQRTPHPRNGGTDWNSLSAIIAENASPGEAVIFDSTTRNARKPRLAKYMYPAAFEGLVDVGLKTPYDQTNGLWDRVYSIDEMTPRLDDHPIVWLVLVKPSFSDDLTIQETYLDTLKAAGYSVAETFASHRSTVYKMIRE